MSRKTTFFIILGFTALALLLSALAYPHLPESVPSHWNEKGEVDGYSSRTFGAFFLPLLTLGFGLMLLFIPNLDPLRANVDKFRSSYHWIIVGFCVYFTYLHGVTLAAGLGWKFDMNTMIMPAFGLLFIGLGFMIERSKQNWFIGIRTPWTLSSTSVWDKTHRTGGLLFKVAGAMALLGLIFPKIGFWLMFIPIIVVSLGTVILSYIYYVQEKKA
ncbi:MAG: SdpI family protein [Anaerolineaceae bacterium]|nr:SdpI family protein [Anaerolineaceae bacterium]